MATPTEKGKEAKRGTQCSAGIEPKNEATIGPRRGDTVSEEAE